jgi:peptidoglycan/xylan/chitin deacetylase (PgdA/CDA1 family)
LEKAATFIMSLDCEGKWGMADHLQPYHDALSDDALANAYDQLLKLLGSYRLRATFAFVMAFTLSADERRQFDSTLKPRKGHADPWLEPYWAAMESGRSEGWHSPTAFDLVRKSEGQEIACHSFCHRPLGSMTPPAEAVAELGAAEEAAEVKGVNLSTFVFPRNEVGNLVALKRYRYLGYRERLRRPSGILGKALSLAAELNTRATPQAEDRGDPALIPIPAGYFFNWRFGARRRIPKEVTLARWSNLLKATARDGGVAHLWMHPHNLITGPDTADVLEKVFAEVAELQQRGDIRVETQEEYCLRLGARGAAMKAEPTSSSLA